ncbi:MAG: hypothetical protein H7331_06610 [Bacteroidia bacterium]|nr:hypothetical protein [Bacteroidia bacterium]
MNYSYKISIKILGCILLVTSVLIGCNKKINWNSNSKHIGIPLAKVHLTLQNILTDSLIKNENNVLTLIHQKNFAAVNLDTLIKLPDTLVKNVLRPTFNYTFSPGTQLYSQLVTTNINTKDIQLTKFQLSEGVIEITYRNTIKESLLMKYTVKSAKKNGQFLVITETVPAATTAGASVLVKEYDLSNYLFDLTGPNGNRYNKLSATISATVNPNGNSIFVKTTDSLVMLSRFKKIKPYYVRGYFGSQVINTQTNTPIHLFKNTKPQQLQLSKASVTLDIVNYTGIDATLKLKSLSTNLSTLTGNVIGKSYALNRAIETGIGQNIISPTKLLVAINEQNTNITQLLNPYANVFNLSTQLSLSPMGNISLGNDFVYGARNIGGIFTVKIPLTFSFANWTLNDTVTYAIDTVNAKKISSGTLHFIIKNGYPVDALTFVSIIDKGKVIIPLLNGSKVLGNTATEQIINVPITNEQLAILIKHNKLLISTQLNTSQVPNLVSLSADAAMDVKITVDFITTAKQ